MADERGEEHLAVQRAYVNECGREVPYFPAQDYGLFVARPSMSCGGKGELRTCELKHFSP